MPRQSYIRTPETLAIRNERSPAAWQIPPPPCDSLRDRSYYGGRAYVYHDQEHMNAGDDVEARVEVGDNDSIVEFRIGRLIDAEDVNGSVVPSYEILIDLPDQKAIKDNKNKQVNPPVVVVPKSTFSSVRPYDKVEVSANGRKKGKSRGIGREVDFYIDSAIGRADEPNRLLLEAIKLRVSMVGALEDHIRDGGSIQAFRSHDVARYRLDRRGLLSAAAGYNPDLKKSRVSEKSDIGLMSVRALKFRLANMAGEPSRNVREQIQASIDMIVCPDKIMGWAENL